MSNEDARDQNAQVLAQIKQRHQDYKALPSGEPTEPELDLGFQNQQEPVSQVGYVYLEIPGAWDPIADFIVTDQEGKPLPDPTDDHLTKDEHLARSIGRWLLFFSLAVTGVWFWSLSTVNNAVGNGPEILAVVLTLGGLLLWLLCILFYYAGAKSRKTRKAIWHGTVNRVWSDRYYYVPTIEEMIDRYSVEYGRPLTGDEVSVLAIKQGEYQHRYDQGVAQVRHNQQMQAYDGIMLLQAATLFEVSRVAHNTRPQ